MITTIVKRNLYLDSIFLMNAAKELMKIPGVRNALAVMASDMNKTVLEEFGGLTSEAQSATPNDVLISIDSESVHLAEQAEEAFTLLLTRRSTASGGDCLTEYRTLSQAADATPDATLAIVSLPGEFAMREALSAIERGLNLFIFSDMTETEEIELKAAAREKNLLVMGPGCGTAVINNLSLGLMSKVRPGRIGIVGASGSGIQEIAVLVHTLGEGISQAIGTGGRDLSERVGGATMLQGIEYLSSDPDTQVIVLVSKPPHPATVKKVYAALPKNKPVVIFFLGGNPTEIRAAGAYAAATLEDAAHAAVSLARGEPLEEGGAIGQAKKELANVVAAEKSRIATGQKYLRGLFCGGTHSEEAVLLLQDFVPNLHSNLSFGTARLLENRHRSVENSLVDMGDEEFTRGKPHPVMDPSILNSRLVQEAADPEVSVILFDLLCGYGAHCDPVGAIEEALCEIRTATMKAGRHISLIASLCATDLDPQDVEGQRRRLEELDVRVLPSNAKAALAAGMIVS